MTINLTEMSRKELLQLQSDVAKALKDAEMRDRRKARIAAEQVAAKYGYTLNELLKSSKSTSSRPPLPPKYRNPENPEQTWSGRGRKPHWINDALKKGTDMSKLEV